MGKTSSQVWILSCPTVKAGIQDQKCSISEKIPSKRGMMCRRDSLLHKGSRPKCNNGRKLNLSAAATREKTVQAVKIVVHTNCWHLKKNIYLTGTIHVTCNLWKILEEKRSCIIGPATIHDVLVHRDIFLPRYDEYRILNKLSWYLHVHQQTLESAVFN